MEVHLWLASGATTTTTSGITTPDLKHIVSHTNLHPLIHSLLALWPVWALIAVAGAVKAVAYLWKLYRLNRAGIFEIDRMSGHEFETKLALMFRSLGYRAEVVGSSGGDYGADLVLSKAGVRTVVQAKCYRRKNVGLKAVQEAHGAKPMYQTDAAMVVTNSRFTKQARRLASSTGVELWDRDDLVRALIRGGKSKQVALANEALQGPAPVVPLASSLLAIEGEATAVVERAPAAVASPSGAFCARCGEPVSVKVRDYCLAHAERFSGLVYCYRDQRGFRPSN